MSAIISIIVAVDNNRGIGYKNKLLYEIPEDLKRFRKITSGHPIIMGYKTFQSIGRPLPGRTNIVLSRDKNLKIDGVFVYDDIRKAIEFAKTKDDKEIFVIGGASIYAQAIDLADRLYLTVINAAKPADTFFPDYSGFTKIISNEHGLSDQLKYSYIILER